MNSIWNKLKLIGGVTSLIVLMILSACGPQYQEPFDSDEQLAIDIELIEDYLDKKGYSDYDTLDSEVRLLVLSEGNGEPIEFNDIISYHYIGRFLTDTLFDTSIKQLAYDQDKRNIIDTTYATKADGTFDLDDNGNKKVTRINYKEGYSPIYSSTRNYTSAKTTHTSTGWYTEQLLSGTVPGYAPAVNFALFNCNIGGSALALLPSYMAYGQFGSSSIPPNSVLMFEIRPVFNRPNE